MKKLHQLQTILLLVAAGPVVMIYAGAKLGEALCGRLCDWCQATFEAIEQQLPPNNRRR